MENNTTNYVCGFYFDSTFEQVVLIWKNKPKWQAGKLNGVGGKIEKGELPITAMRREFHEETGIFHNEWVDLIVLQGEDWRVYFFCAIGKVNEFEYVETKEDEEIAKIEVNRLLANEYAHIPNLEWLIPMAMQRLQFPQELMSFSDSDKALQAKCDRQEAALRQISENEGECCMRCEGNAKLWADGNAHLPSYDGPTVNCGNCGGSGRIHEDLQEIANEALSAGEGEKEEANTSIISDEMIHFVEWAVELAYFDDEYRLWNFYEEGKSINDQFRFTTKEFYEVFFKLKGDKNGGKSN